MNKIKYILLILLLYISIKALKFKTDKINKNKFESRRLGNVIDLCYFGTLYKHPYYLERLSRIDNVMERDSFSIFLIKKLISQEKKQISKKDFSMSQKLDLYKISKEKFAIYDYKNIKITVNDYYKYLKEMMEEFDNIHENKLLDQKFEDDKHCLIHYRLGDVVSLGDVIDYKYIIQTLKDLKINFSAIEIMDGGRTHTGKPFGSLDVWKNFILNTDLKESNKIYEGFYQELKDNFPNTKIIQSPKKSTDEDFFRMSSAPILVTGAGSYALAACIGGKSRIIRTPASKDLDFPSLGNKKIEKIPKKNSDWITYDYRMY